MCKVHSARFYITNTLRLRKLACNKIVHVRWREERDYRLTSFCVTTHGSDSACGIFRLDDEKAKRVRSIWTIDSHSHLFRVNLPVIQANRYFKGIEWFRSMIINRRNLQGHIALVLVQTIHPLQSLLKKSHEKAIRRTPGAVFWRLPYKEHRFKCKQVTLSKANTSWVSIMMALTMMTMMLDDMTKEKLGDKALAAC